jgi:hypothetical protein
MCAAAIRSAAPPSSVPTPCCWAGLTLLMHRLVEMPARRALRRRLA